MRYENVVQGRFLSRPNRFIALVELDGKPFRRRRIFNFMIKYLCPIFAAIILASSVANALGWIAM